MASDKIIVISTHILQEVDALCTRAMIIAHGRLLADDTPAGLLARSRYHNGVTLTVDDPERAASELSGLSAAREVEVRNARVTVFPSGRGDLFREVAGLINDHGWTVHHLRHEPGRSY